jgi:hypothetical protein
MMLDSLPRLLLIAGLSASTFSNCCAVTRTWTDVSGRFRVEAELVRIENDRALLKRPSGAEVWVPIKRLSAVDRELIGTLESAENPPPTPTPSPEAAKFTADMQSRVKDVKMQLASARKSVLGRQKAELKNASTEQGKQNDAEAEARKKEELTRVAARLAMPHFMRDPDVTRVKAFPHSKGMVLAAYRGNDKSTRLYFINDSAEPVSGVLSVNLMQDLTTASRDGIEITRQDVQQLARGNAGGRGNRAAGPLVELKQRHRAELEVFQQAQRLIAKAELEARQAIESINVAPDKLPVAPDKRPPPANEIEQIREKFEQDVTAALSLVSAKPNNADAEAVPFGDPPPGDGEPMDRAGRGSRGRGSR